MTEDSHFPSANLCLVLVIVSYVAAILLTFLSAPLFPKADLLVGEIFLIVPVSVYLRLKGYPLLKSFRINPVDRKTLGVSILLGLSITVLIDEVDRIIGSFIEIPPEFEETLSKALTIESASDAVILITAAVLLAGLFEEMIFRGLLQQAFEKKLNSLNALFVTALVFSFMHLYSPWLIQIFLLGLILGYLAWRSRSIFPGIILHCFNNAFALLLLNAKPEALSLYNWNGHVYPPFLVVASGITYYGVKWFHNHTEDASEESQLT